MIPAPQEQYRTDTFTMTSLAVWKLSVILCAIALSMIMTVIEPGSKEKNLACLVPMEKNKTTKTSLVVFVHYAY
jgi:hypothetical protein